jgi:hypothetical protein
VNPNDTEQHRRRELDAGGRCHMKDVTGPR